MTIIVDRRQYSKDKNIENVKRFNARHKVAIQKGFGRMLAKQNKKNNQSIKDTKGFNVDIGNSDQEIFLDVERDNMDEVFAKNKKYQVGDTIKKSESDKAGKQGSPDGNGNDNFIYDLTVDEVEELFFKDLELPNLRSKLDMDIEDVKYKHGGYHRHGLPSNISVVRSFKNSLGRQEALRATYQDMIEECTDEQTKKELQHMLDTIPFLDDIDLRYKFQVPKPQPSIKAVCIFIMDVSGSMNQDMKNNAKLFFLLQSLFISKKYSKMEIVFIRHDTSAEECTEEEFFYETKTGGTCVSPAMNLAIDILKDRYPKNRYNAYVTYAGDGDNWDSDNLSALNAVTDLCINYTNAFIYLYTPPYGYSDTADLNTFTSVIKDWTSYSYSILLFDTLINYVSVFSAFASIFRKRGK